MNDGFVVTVDATLGQHQWHYGSPNTPYRPPHIPSRLACSRCTWHRLLRRFFCQLYINSNKAPIKNCSKIRSQDQVATASLVLQQAPGSVGTRADLPNVQNVTRFDCSHHPLHFMGYVCFGLGQYLFTLLYQILLFLIEFLLGLHLNLIHVCRISSSQIFLQTYPMAN